MDKHIEKSTTHPRGTDNARVIQVIETRSVIGRGTEDDVCREVVQLWDFEGKLLATNDPVEKTH